MARKVLYIVFVALLFLPLSNFVFHYMKSKKLNGWQAPAEKPVLSINNLFSGDFQDKAEKYYKQNTGFATDFIRLRNEVFYSCLHINPNRDMIISKDGYFYENSYIFNGVLGHDFVGEDTVVCKAEKIKRLQDTLRKEGKDLIVVFAAGKGSYFKEHIPEELLHQPKKTTNYEAYSSCFKEIGVNFIDFKAWFLAMKDTISYPLFTKLGLHWNKFGVALVTDSLVRYYDKIFPDMPSLTIDYSIINNKNWFNESDGFDNLNTIFHPKYERLPHPELYYKQKNDRKRPMLITVADSYNWSLHAYGFADKYFEDSQYWYYNDFAYCFGERGNIDMKDENFVWEDEIKKASCFMLLFTDANLKDFDRGFIDKLYTYYFER